MFERFPPPGEDGANNKDDNNDNKEETLIVPPDYERVFLPDRSSMKGMMIHDPSHHSPAQILESRATKASMRHERGKALIMEEPNTDSN
ncbi:hypothetical protein J1N35_014625 [Gossypium stocksii]|uniref:Uncharacterized protein n=1 Tax=Gossypium stocksii TaxID=47602 RepID=A0A9D3VWR6_9ROSI|nr:hypothetical protein J1N35_014625 [Gossypium stocksii]